MAWVIGRENQLLYCTQVEGEQMAWNSTSTVIHHQTFAPDRKLLASNQTNNIFINFRTEMIICKINGESFNSVRATKIVCNRLWKMVKAGIDTQIMHMHHRSVYQTIYNLDHSVACSYVCGAEGMLLGVKAVLTIWCVSYCVLSTDIRYPVVEI